MPLIKEKIELKKQEKRILSIVNWEKSEIHSNCYGPKMTQKTNGLKIDTKIFNSPNFDETFIKLSYHETIKSKFQQTTFLRRM